VQHRKDFTADPSL